ncbi:MAG: class I SAM-dependent methyltransferase [Longimicrobiales bacterium]
MRALTDQPDPGAHHEGRADLIAWNEAMVERYDIERYYEQSHGIVRWLERRRLDTLHTLAAPKSGDLVLEVGCGAGHVLERFENVRRIGVDMSEGMLARSRRRLGNAVDLARGSAGSLPFASATFDIVLCTEVLEHVADPAAVIAELVRVVRPGGRVIVSIPNEANIDRAKRVLRRTPLLRTWLRTLAAEGNEWHLHDFDLPMLRRFAAGSAEIRRLKGIPGRFMPLRWVAELGPVAAPASLRPPIGRSA